MSTVEWIVFLGVVAANLACSWYWLWMSRKNLREAERMMCYVRMSNAILHRVGQLLRMGLREEAEALMEPYERDCREGTALAYMDDRMSHP